MTKLQTLIARLFRIQAPEAPKGPLVARDTQDFTLTEWRKTDALVSAARELVRNKTFKLMREVLDNENPCHRVIAFGVSPNDRVVQQARIEGYEMCLNNLGAFAKPLKLTERLESTFEPPQEPNKK